MSRINQIAPENATGPAAELFAAVKGKLGMVPNMMRAIGNSPAALSAYLQFSGNLAGGSLSNQQREQIALAVGEANQCDYCLAAHSALGKMAGLSTDQIRDARRSSAVDPKSDALVRFASTLVKRRGNVSDEELQELRQHGFTDADITEVVANVALNIFTNYFNHVADTEIDFPKAERLEPQAA
ncbi:peroxidase-related enzyme [Roseiconus nitratireducens]|uniref:Peroxidase-related enzyme n=1 Tax=Roseiconus nitratireducens TaxID=2605748 RepID=A0A5M6CXI5_9BACT|nr:peroxidase-related enzyme [Roseiconus nitratireducens]KAA5537959.1 peroxidase-related enzyme [Roseiconus nitratireducens]